MSLSEIKTADGTPLSELEPPYWHIGYSYNDFRDPIRVDTVIIKRGLGGVLLIVNAADIDFAFAYQTLEAARRGLIRRHIEAARRIFKNFQDDIPF